MDTGTISGLVRDSSGGGIPAVHVKIADESTGLATEVATNPTGLYVSPPLRAGTYVVEARASGFEAAAKRVWFLFEVALCTVLTMYGGGFATIPAFLADLFGPENVGAIHGAVLTAWSAAAVVGPVIITELSARSRSALKAGMSKVHIYDQPLQVLAGLLVVGFILTLLVRPIRVSASSSPERDSKEVSR